MMLVSDDYNYDVSISYAGQDSLVATELAGAMTKAGLNVYFNGAAWGEDLPDHLADVYSNGARFCVMLWSKHYQNSSWANFERKVVQGRSIDASGPVCLPLKLDDSELPSGFGSLKYLQLSEVGIEGVINELLRLVREDQPQGRTLKIGLLWGLTDPLSKRRIRLLLDELGEKMQLTYGRHTSFVEIPNTSEMAGAQGDTQLLTHLNPVLAIITPELLRNEDVLGTWRHLNELHHKNGQPNPSLFGVYWRTLPDEHEDQLDMFDDVMRAGNFLDWRGQSSDDINSADTLVAVDTLAGLLERVAHASVADPARHQQRLTACIRFPNFPESLIDGTIVEILVKEGDCVAENQPLVAVEGDKTAVEIPAPYCCTITKIDVKLNDTVRRNTRLLTVEFDEGEDSEHQQTLLNVRTAVCWLATRDIEYLVWGRENNKTTFDLSAFKPFANAAIEIGKAFEKMPLDRLDQFVTLPLRKALFEVSQSVRQMERFSFREGGTKLRDFRRVTGYLEENLEHAVQQLYHSYLTACSWLHVEPQVPDQFQKDEPRRLVLVADSFDTRLGAVETFICSLGLDPVRSPPGDAPQLLSSWRGTPDTRSNHALLVFNFGAGTSNGKRKSRAPGQYRPSALMAMGALMSRLEARNVTLLVGTGFELPELPRDVCAIRYGPRTGWKKLLRARLLDAGFAVSAGPH